MHIFRHSVEEKTTRSLIRDNPDRKNKAFSILILVPLTIVVMLFTSFESANGGEVPFTREGIASLKGKNICDLQGEFFVGTGVYLNYQKQYVLDYRTRDGVDAVFLLSKPSQDCGIVEAVLDLTPLIKTGENMEFKCYTKHEGGTTWKNWGRIIGLADNQQGRKRFVKARMAWRVNVKEKRFEEIKDEKVECDTAGYTD
jgi:hypothetical protein